MNGRAIGARPETDKRRGFALLDKMPPEMHQVLLAIAGLVPTALVARLLWHRRLVQLGHRRFWSRDLFWELPLAVFCAVLAGGAASYLHLDPLATQALTGGVAWLGPRGGEVMLARFLDRYATSDKKD
jgi:hypothetical protein